LTSTPCTAKQENPREATMHVVAFSGSARLGGKTAILVNKNI
jgi:hypothetical protein